MLEKIKQMIFPRLFFFCVLAICLGIAAGFLLHPSIMLATVIAGIGLVVSIIFVCRRKYLVLLLFSACAGCLLAAVDDAMVKPFPASVGETAVVYGTVCERELSSEAEESAAFFIKPQDVEGIQYRYGTVKVFCRREQEPELGDKVIVRGEMMAQGSIENSNKFDYSAYMRRNNIAARLSAIDGGEVIVDEPNHSIFLRFVDTMRHRLNSLAERLGEEAAAPVRGIILGDKSDLLYVQKEAYIRSGILHAFAVSGMHISFVLVFSTMLFGFIRRKKWLYLLLNSLLLFFYCSFMGFSPSVSRAFIMAEAGLFALIQGESRDTYTAIGLAALLCLLYRPMWLFDAGFQLSFLTVFFMVYLNGSFKSFFAFAGRFAPTLIAACSAALAAMPLVAYYFYTVSPISLPFSPIAVLLVEACVLWGLCAMLFVMLWQPLAYIFIYVAGAVLRLLTFLAQWLTELTGSYFTIGVPPLWLVFAAYALLLFLPFIKKYMGRIIMLIAAFVLAVGFPLAGAAFGTGLPARDGELQVSFIDVGQGDCTFIHTPDGKNILIDGGGYGDSGTVGEYILLPYLKSHGVQRLDLVISTHPDFDHMDGLLSVLENMTVDYCMVTGVKDVDNYQIERAARRNDAVLLYGVSGQSVSVGRQICLDIIFPTEDFYGGETNEASLVCLLSYGEHSFLFTGDTEAEGLDFIIDSGIRANVLKVPHHGSYYNFDALLYESVQPEYAVISCGKDNRYGHPHHEVVEYLQEQHIPTYRTDLHGEICFISDGHNLRILTVKK